MIGSDWIIPAENMSPRLNKIAGNMLFCIDPRHEAKRAKTRMLNGSPKHGIRFEQSFNSDVDRSRVLFLRFSADSLLTTSFRAGRGLFWIRDVQAPEFAQRR